LMTAIIEANRNLTLIALNHIVIIIYTFYNRGLSFVYFFIIIISFAY
jgi:hypothetical protein